VVSQWWIDSEIDLEKITYLGPVMEEVVSVNLRPTGQSQMTYGFLLMDDVSKRVFRFDSFDEAMRARQQLVSVLMEVK
jgi:hypothetical protein